MPVETAAPSAPPATHPADENATSEVSGWLQEHGHPELAETFAKAGYQSLAALGMVEVRAGKNTLVIETDKVIPALRELRFVPENPYVDLPVEA